uniref:Uncharacterized protein n=1 Tax=Chromera velia CCMP2878 TaxID=1169474 RepID=A0A0G4F5G9_9ALVE|eukprot:Cvel_15330.t1-p1 / transcript=Cvel_15330.t1 / gene=Cvel_15330 / organism=Chromera_velia_CCMP2878 / gene_product=hypothetical protein / transcript_product=hypothetical protein / location=Cvel_scaffold1127:37985-40734(+) / protein_length=437 / sequence_SO=supercontig / SO=protein_coding / is_pseudo=false
MRFASSTAALLLVCCAFLYPVRSKRLDVTLARSEGTSPSVCSCRFFEKMVSRIMEKTDQGRIRTGGSIDMNKMTMRFLDLEHMEVWIQGMKLNLMVVDPGFTGEKHTTIKTRGDIPGTLGRINLRVDTTGSAHEDARTGSSGINRDEVFWSKPGRTETTSHADFFDIETDGTGVRGVYNSAKDSILGAFDSFGSWLNKKGVIDHHGRVGSSYENYDIMEELVDDEILPVLSSESREIHKGAGRWFRCVAFRTEEFGDLPWDQVPCDDKEAEIDTSRLFKNFYGAEADLEYRVAEMDLKVEACPTGGWMDVRLEKLKDSTTPHFKMEVRAPGKAGGVLGEKRGIVTARGDLKARLLPTGSPSPAVKIEDDLGFESVPAWLSTEDLRKVIYKRFQQEMVNFVRSYDLCTADHIKYYIYGPTDTTSLETLPCPGVEPVRI